MFYPFHSSGVTIDTVNLLTTKAYYTDKPTWGEAIIGYGEEAVEELRKIWPSKSTDELYAMLAITPMIEMNQVGRTFHRASALRLVAWAKEKNLGRLSFWKLTRSCINQPKSECSNIDQRDAQFVEIFQQFV